MKLVAERPGRIDKLIADAFPQYSRAALAKLFEQGLVQLDSMPHIKAGHKVREGAVVDVDTSPLDQELQVVELPILYEDDDVVVINKPVGIISHARGKYWYEPSVASFLRWHLGPKNLKGTIIQNAKHTPDGLTTKSYPLTAEDSVAGDRAGIVHRLDRATSGVMICAKNDTAVSYLQKQFGARTVQKTYVAVLEGRPKLDEAVIDAPIERNPKNPSLFRVGPRGKTAQTLYKVLRATEDGNQPPKSLVEFRPKTGRTHQLRVHAAYIGHPIVGDELYGKPAERLFLHAEKLEIALPNGEKKTFVAPLPKEFEGAV